MRSVRKLCSSFCHWMPIMNNYCFYAAPAPPAAAFDDDDGDDEKSMLIRFHS